MNKLIEKFAKLEKLMETKMNNYELKINEYERKIAAFEQKPNSPSDQGEFETWKRTVEERIEERTNRQMRKTLVFRGIEELASEKYMADTDKILSEVVSDALDYNDVKFVSDEMIDRCHRTGDSKYYKQQKRVRPITAAMHSWKDCEKLIMYFRKKRCGISVDYKYGPLTTKRRNLAMKLRKEMKSAEQINQAYVRYPAILMGKKRGENNYSIIRDFSKDIV